MVLQKAKDVLVDKEGFHIYIINAWDYNNMLINWT